MSSLVIETAQRLAGKILVPGDKSISHRAAILSALAQGKTILNNFLTAADCLSTIECLKKLGVEIEEPRGNTVIVHGSGVSGLQEPTGILDAGNSGTTMRLLAGVLASVPFFSIITGDASLRERPMARVVSPLQAMGASIAGRRNNTMAPLAITGTRLKGIKYNTPVASAQVKSAILLAGLQAEGETSVTEPALSRDHTERMLQHFGVPVTRSGLTVSLQGPCQLRGGGSINIPGDISSAAFFIVAAAIVSGSGVTIQGVGVNPTRTGILDVLKQMGANITLENVRQECGEPVADIRVTHSPLRGVSLGGEIIPRLIDEIPVLAVAAAVAQGETVITGASELKYKETDRLKAIITQLSRMGARITELPDGMIIKGAGRLKGARCHSLGDHRMAMALSVAGLVAGGKTVIENTSCIDISFPGFIDVLNSLTVE